MADTTTVQPESQAFTPEELDESFVAAILNDRSILGQTVGTDAGFRLDKGEFVREPFDVNDSMLEQA